MKITNLKSWILVVAVVAAVTITTAAQGGRLDDTGWKLAEARGRAVRNTSAVLNFNGDSTRFTGNTGCNSMFGGVFIRGRQIDFDDVGATKRYCKLMPGNVAESVFLSALKSARFYRLAGQSLRLIDRRGRTVLRFVRSSDRESGGQVRLEDRKWILEQIKDRQTFAPLPMAFITFDAAKRSAGGDTSCNLFGGTYSATGKKIAVSEIISTMRACVEDESKMSTERDLLDGLRRANRYEIRDGRLFLYRNNELLLTFLGEQK